MSSSERPFSRPEAHDEDTFLRQIYSVLADSDPEDLATLLRKREEELGITETQAANVLGFGSVTQLRRIKSGQQKKLDALTMVKLSNYLGLGVDGVARVIVAKMEPDEIGDIEATRARHFVAKNFPLKALKKAGFIEDHNDLDAAVERITSFFRLPSIFDYGKVIPTPLFMQRQMSFQEELRAFWIESAYYQFDQHRNPFPFDREQVSRLIPHIRQYTRHEGSGLLTVAKALFRAGVTVIVQPYLGGTAVHGATFIVDGKPCIVLTDLGKKYPVLWFSLYHELVHVLYDWEHLERWKHHLSGAGEIDSELIEDRANTVAHELMMPRVKLDFIAPHLRSRLEVARYAKQNDVHSSIVYWLYARREYFDSGDTKWFKIYNKDIRAVDPERAIRALTSYPWEKEHVDSDMESIINELASA